MRIRRWTTKRGKDTIKTKLLFHGFVRCAYCGWKLGPYYAEYKNGKPKRISYRCRGIDSRRSTGCKFKKVQAKVLDNLLWNAFIKLAEDPEELEKRILKEEFIVDKDRADLKAMKDQAKAQLDDYKVKIRRFNWLVMEGEMPKDQYFELNKDIKIMRQKAEERLEKANAALRRPRDIKYAAKRATKIVADQVQVTWYLEQIKELSQKASGLVESANTDRAMAGDSEEENLRALLKQLYATKTNIEVLDLSLKIIEELKKNREGPTADDLIYKGIRQLIFQQKRLILQQFIDPERGIDIWSKDKFEIHLSIPKLASDLEVSKKNKSLKHLSRPALPPVRV
jgi:hypothetical protein